MVKEDAFGLNKVQLFFVLILGIAILAYVIVIVFGILQSSTIIPQEGFSSVQTVLAESTQTLSPIGTGVTSSEVKANNQTWLEFDGVNDILSSGNKADFNFTTNFTVSFWYNWNGDDAGQFPNPIRKGNSYEVFFSGSSNVINFKYSNLTVFTDYGGFESTLHEWNYYVVSFNQTHIDIYNNSDLSVSVLHGGVMNTTLTELFIGGVNNYDGGIDEVRLYNVPLVASQISEIYSSGRQANSSLPSDGLVLWYSFDESEGLVVHDKSGNENHGE